MPEQTNTVPTLQLASLRHENDGLLVTKTSKGAQTLVPQKQKEWVATYMQVQIAAGKPISKNAAKREYEKYRLEASKAMSQEIGRKIAAGEVLVSKASANKEGNLTGVQFMKPKEADSIKLTGAIGTLVKGLKLDENLVRQILAKAKAEREAKDDAVIDVGGTAVPANAEAPKPTEPVAVGAVA